MNKAEFLSDIKLRKLHKKLLEDGKSLWNDISFRLDTFENNRIFIEIAVQSLDQEHCNVCYLQFKNSVTSSEAWDGFKELGDWFFVMMNYKGETVETISFEEILDNSWHGRKNIIPYGFAQHLKQSLSEAISGSILDIDLEFISPDVLIVSLVGIATESNLDEAKRTLQRFLRMPIDIGVLEKRQETKLVGLLNIDYGNGVRRTINLDT